MVVVVYAPTDQSSAEDKDSFYLELKGIMANANGLTMGLLTREWLVPLV